MNIPALHILLEEQLLHPDWAGLPKYCYCRAEAPGLPDSSRAELALEADPELVPSLSEMPSSPGSGVSVCPRS